MTYTLDQISDDIRQVMKVLRNQPEPYNGSGNKLWLWKNFVDGRPEYLAFDNPYPTYGGGDPMTLGEPCGYALFKESTLAPSHADFSETDVIAAIQRASERAATSAPTFNLAAEVAKATARAYPIRDAALTRRLDLLQADLTQAMLDFGQSAVVDRVVKARNDAMVKGAAW